MADGGATPTEDGRVVPTDISLQFTSIPDCVTCEPVTFEWNYSGNPNLELMLAVTNIGINDLPEGTPILSQTIHIFNGGALGDVSEFTWDEVDIPAGLYTLEAWIANIPYTSSTFTISNGTDTTCLADSLPPPPPITESTTSTATSTTSSTTNTGNDLPVVGATGNGGMSGGTIAGIAVAIIGALGALVGAFLLYRYYRRRNSERRPLSPTRPRSGFYEKGPNSPKRSGSAGARLVYGGQLRDGFNDSEAFGVAANRSSRHGHLNEYNKDNQSTRSYPGASDEDVASFSEEKMVTNAPSGAYDFITAADLPTLPSRYRNSSASYAEPAGSRPRLYTRNSDPFATPRVQQLPVGMFDERIHTPVSPAFPQSVSASPASTKRRLSGESARSNLTGLGLGLGLSTGPPSQSQSQYLSPPAAFSPAPGRRTMSARKPVPAYTADDDNTPESEAHELLHSPTSLRASGTLVGHGSSQDHHHQRQHGSTSSSSPSQTENDWSSTAQVSHTALTPSPSLSVSSIGMAESSPVPRIPHPDLPELNHKSSFGDRPVHYLIPDPLPSQEQVLQSQHQHQQRTPAPSQPPQRPPRRR